MRSCCASVNDAVIPGKSAIILFDRVVQLPIQEDKMDKKMIMSFIKDLMKKNGFKNTGDFFFKHLKDNFVIVDFSIVETMQTYVEYKKYSYDDINWKMHKLEELSSKSDSQRVLGAQAIFPVTYQKYIDEYKDEEDLLSVISTRIERIVSVDLPAIEAIDVNEVILNGDLSNKMKCLALLDLGRIDEAIALAKDCVKNGEDGGEIFWGLTFFQLLVNVYSSEAVYEANVDPLENASTFSGQPSEVIDNIDWHYDSAKKAYSEVFGEFNLELVDINRYAAAHIVYFLAWLIMNDALEKTSAKELSGRIENVKNKIESPTDILLDYFDGKLLRSDIDPKYVRFIDSYFEDGFIHDYSNMLIGFKEDAYLTEFRWERYKLLEPVITTRYNSFMRK